tara:strand:- start:855 stop:2045 length:1191 start_codon:yes stop_codon:yes gene_type:complete
MLFQIIDNKTECHGIYFGGEIYSDLPMEELSQTWGYTRHLADYDIECASLYCSGKSLEDVCPSSLKEDMERVSKKMKALLLSLATAKISLDDFCFFDMVPERFLLEYCHLKDEISAHVLSTYERPKNYDFLFQLSEVIEEIGARELNIDEKALRDQLVTIEARNFLKRVQASKDRALYNIFGTKTGRLTTKKNSFPILTMNRRFRKILKPNNDWFLELDFNAAELRTVLALLNIKQPKEDIHAWNIKNIFSGKDISRDEAKKKIFAWLYNPNAIHQTANLIYDRDSIKKKHFDGSAVHTVFDRTIECDDYRAVNYIIQSTTSDLMLQQMIKVHDILREAKSHIAFCMHDSIVIDFSDSDRDLVLEIAKIFRRTIFGDFKINIKAGKNYGKMRKLNV